MDKCDILLTHDDPQMLDIISWSLKDRGYDVATASSATDATKRLKEHHFDVVLTQLTANPEDGATVLKQAKQVDPETIVIMLGGKEIEKYNCEKLPQEADEYVFTPCGIPKLWKRVQNCLEKLDLKRRDAHCMASRKYLVELAKQMKLTTEGTYGSMDPGVAAALAQQLETVYELIGQTNTMLDASPARTFVDKKVREELGKNTTHQ